ncbi:MAG: glycosyltransferase family 4 protein [Actinomycetota bacterium]|nr:glycosyltransferase family 4 protein [Actinomycetota bacterium]
MRLLAVVQRYGTEVAGGAEAFCRMVATGMVERGHRVEVVTSRARSYQDWADVYPAGDSELDGVTVRRLSVRQPRMTRFFAPLNSRAMWGHQPSALTLQEAWLQAQGPDLDGLRPLLRRRAPAVDAVATFTYLYSTTAAALTATAGAAPTVLHPTAHDEPPFWLPVFDRILALPTAFAWSTEEERDLVWRRAGRRLPGAIMGIGTALGDGGDAERFRRRFSLGAAPYLLYTGRIDTAKAADELYEQFVAYVERHPGTDLRLVMVGDPVLTLPEHPSVVVTGFVDDATRTDAVAGCLVMVVPSYLESFSMALTEAWAQHRPALVQGRSPVLAGQARRSQGAIAYRSFAEFEAAVELLGEQPAVAEALGGNGRLHVITRYSWDAVLSRYEALLADAGRRHRQSQRRERSALDVTAN